jgi:hypothetical protein
MERWDGFYYCFQGSRPRATTLRNKLSFSFFGGKEI